MIEHTLTEQELLKLYPTLRNVRHRKIYDDARQRCLLLGANGGDYVEIPLYSHDATRQAIFNIGWCSITDQDIRLYKATQHIKDNGNETKKTT